MTPRKRKGIGFIISGIVFLGAGVTFVAAPSTPDWLGIVISAIGAIANVLGFTTVFPDTDE